jgi:Ca2+-binding RTX toxin-like protein
MLNPQYLQLVKTQLAQFATQTNFAMILKTAFGANISAAKIATLRQQWTTGDFSLIPQIDILSNGELGRASGGFAASENKIFVSSTFLTKYQNDPKAITGFLIEEIGHKLDRVFNGTVDSAGDEGEIFSRLVSGETLSPQTLARLKTEDDTALITVGGKVISIEQSVISGTAGNDILLGGTGNDELYGEGTMTSSTLEQVIGGSGNDLLYGEAGNDELYGDVGNDELYGGTGDDELFGNTGNDSLFGDVGSDTISGEAGDDKLFGGADTDYLYGGAGNDTINGEVGNDELFGEDGNDGLFGGDGNDKLSGGNDNDALAGAAGNDTLLGGIGNDNLDGGDGNDNLSGGTGNDSGLLATTDFGEDYLVGGAGDDILTGGFSNDTLYGDAGNDILNGDDGNDNLFGGAGNDILNDKNGYFVGGAGDDTLNGGSSDNFYVIDADIDLGTDTINDAEINFSEFTRDTLDFSTTTTKAINLDLGVTTVQTVATGVRLVIPVINIEQVNGGSLGDTIVGTNSLQGEIIIGNGGNDTLSGGGGSDLLIGGDGNDTLNGGGWFNDIPFLEGQRDDVLTGGAGNDRFVFTSTAPLAGANTVAKLLGKDIIDGFVQGQDKIVLSKATFTGITAVNGTITNFASVADDTLAATSSAAIVYSTSTRNFIYNQNGAAAGFGANGGVFAQSFNFTGILTVAASDFEIV